MSSVSSSRVKKKYVICALRNFTPNSPSDQSSHEWGLTYSGIWVSGQEDASSNPAFAPYADIADALSYADDLNNNRIQPSSAGPTYLAPGLPQGQGGTDDGLTYYWGVMEIWAIDPAVDPS